MNRLIILVGEGINQHTLYGDFKFQENKNVSTQDALHGVLEINKPVKEYAPHTPYKHFYMVQTPDGVRLADRCRVGWGWNTDGWATGQFFTARLDSALSP